MKYLIVGMYGYTIDDSNLNNDPNSLYITMPTILTIFRTENIISQSEMIS